MKKLTNIFRSILLVFNFIFIFCISNSLCIAANSNLTGTSEVQSTSNSLTSDDWKIVLDDTKNSNEFDFIQKNLSSSNLPDNGYFLLILGIILILFSVLGITYFSIKLYKISKNTHLKKSKYKRNRYK